MFVVENKNVSFESHDKNKTERDISPSSWWKSLMLVSILGITSLLFIAPQNVYADGSGNADYVNGADCMQTLYGKKLNCTANDINLASVTDIELLPTPNDPPDGETHIGCRYPGDMVKFRADFEMDLTAQERHDLGLFIAESGDALTGTCTAATPAYAPDQPWLDLDGTNDDPNGVTQDTCGDIDADHDPLYPSIELTVTCADDDGNQLLDLNNCTSWRQPGANELCTSPLQAIPGAPSKCRCSTINIDIPVPPANIVVIKKAFDPNVDPVVDPADLVEMLEPGGPVTFLVTVENGGVDPSNPVTIRTLNDNIFGDLFDESNSEVISNSCDDEELTWIIPQGSAITCSFTANVIGSASDPDHVDIVRATGVDARGNPVNNSDDATVKLTDVDPVIEVTKTPGVDRIDEPGGLVEFTFVVINKSVEEVEITELTDSIFTLTGDTGVCDVGTVLAPMGEAGDSCSFTQTENIFGNATEKHTNWFTAKAEDDEGNVAEDSDDAVVEFADVPSSIEVIKTASPTSVDEPGGNVTFTVVINNLSSVDTVYINDITDNVHDNINGEGDCLVTQTILPGGSYSCSFEAYVEGNAGYEEEDIVTASGVDDDGNPVEDDDPAWVSIDNVPPEASLTKTVTKMMVTYEVEVTNNSSVDVVTVDALKDNKFGDLTLQEGDCDTVIGVNIPVNESISCSFTAEVTTSPHENTVTGTVSDDDDSDVTPSPEASATVTFDPATPTP